MSAKSLQFIEQLKGLPTYDRKGDLIEQLYDLCYLIEDDPDSSEVIPHIFAFFEADPEADIGLPSPLVRFLEAQSTYEAFLIESVLRKPVANTIWMVNSVLNTKLTPERRAFFLDLLRGVEMNPRADEIAKDHAENVIAYQMKRSQV